MHHTHDLSPKNRPYRRVYMVLLLIVMGMVSTGCRLRENIQQGGAGTTFEGPPLVTITSPLPNATYLEGTSVNIFARVENAGSDMGRILVQVNDTVIGDQDISAQAGAPAFSISQSWAATQPGTHTISVTAFRADGTASPPASVTINVRGQAAPAVVTAGNTPAQNTNGQDAEGQNTGEQPPMPTAQPTQPTDNTGSETGSNVPSLPSDTDAQTEPPAEASPQPAQGPTAAPTNAQPIGSANQARGRVLQGANIRSGPDTSFQVVGSMPLGAQIDLIGVNSDRTWYKVQTGGGGDGWIFGELLELSGDVDSLRVDAGPTPPTQQPGGGSDLTVIAQANLPLVCNQASTITVTVTNAGTQASGASSVVVEDLYNNTVAATTSSSINPLEPGGTQAVALSLTVNTNFAEGHVLRVRVDPSNQVPESNEDNNAQTYNYVLQQGNC